MSANTSPIFPAVPWAATADLTAASACTTRGPIAHSNMAATPCYATQFSGTNTNGLRVDKIRIQAASTGISAPTAAQTILIWLDNGTTAYVVDELQASAQTPSATTPAFALEKLYTNLVIPPGWNLWASTTVATTTSTTALTVTAFGGTY